MTLRGVLRTPSTSVMAAEEMATRPKRTAVIENCILANCGVQGMINGLVFRKVM